MNKQWMIGLIALFFILALSRFASAETIVLKSGQKIEGKITEKTDEYVKVDVSGVSVPYFMDEIARIDSEAPAASRPMTIDSAPASLTDKTPKEIFASLSPAVVYIISMTASGEQALGSGFIIDKDGVVVTNYHVIKLTEGISIKLKDGTIYPVTGVIHYDIERDICILKIDGKDLPTVSLSNSDTVQTGEKIYVIGNPLGLEYTFSDGMLSGKRDYQDLNYLQFTAPVSPGNSGGPLITGKGQVIGIVTFVMGGGQNLNFALAIDEIKKFIGKNPRMTMQEFIGKTTQAAYLIIAGNKSSLSGDYEEALAFYKEAVEVDPELAEGYNYIGSIYKVFGQYQQAIPYFEKAIQLKSNLDSAYRNLGYIYVILGQSQEAISYLEKAVKLDPSQDKAYNELGIAYYALGKSDKALTYCRKAIRNNPYYAPAWLNLGTIMFDRDNYRLAESAWYNAIISDPNFVYAYIYMADLLLTLNRNEEAKEYLLKAKEIYKFREDKEGIKYVDELLKEHGGRKKFLGLF